MKRTDKAYYAGLFDGEGTVTMTKKKKDLPFRVPVVSMSSTTLELLEHVQHNYGGSISPHKTYKDHHKISWSWKLDNRKALDFLRDIRPYMKEPEKCRRADLLLRDYIKLTPRNGRYNQYTTAQRLCLEIEFFANSLVEVGEI